MENLWKIYGKSIYKWRMIWRPVFLGKPPYDWSRTNIIPRIQLVKPGLSWIWRFLRFGKDQTMNPNWWPIYGWDFKHPKKSGLMFKEPRWTICVQRCSQIQFNLQDVARFKARSSMTFWGKPDVKIPMFHDFGVRTIKKTPAISFSSGFFGGFPTLAERWSQISGTTSIREIWRIWNSEKTCSDDSTD